MSIERRAVACRSVPSAVARAAGVPTIVGYAAVFYRAGDPGTVFPLSDDAEERILPGAFDRAIREDDVRALFNHDATLILGRNTAGTLRLSADSKGLRYEIDPPDTQTARDVVAMLKRGDVSGSSFAFEPVRTNVRREGDRFIRELVEVRLYDVGPVTYPAYSGSSSGSRDNKPLTPAERARMDLQRLELTAVAMAMQTELDGGERANLKPATPKRAAPPPVRPFFGSTRLGSRW